LTENPESNCQPSIRTIGKNTIGENDANALFEFSTKHKFCTKTLLSKEFVNDGKNVFDENLKQLASKAKNGDFVFISITCHCIQLQCDNGQDDEVIDEAFLLKPESIINEQNIFRDDDFFKAMKRFSSGVNVFCLLVCCHAEGMIKFETIDKNPLLKYLEPKNQLNNNSTKESYLELDLINLNKEEVSGNILVLAACLEEKDFYPPEIPDSTTFFIDNFIRTYRKRMGFSRLIYLFCLAIQNTKSSFNPLNVIYNSSSKKIFKTINMKNKKLKLSEEPLHSKIVEFRCIHCSNETKPYQNGTFQLELQIFNDYEFIESEIIPSEGYPNSCGMTHLLATTLNIYTKRKIGETTPNKLFYLGVGRYADGTNPNLPLTVNFFEYNLIRYPGVQPKKKNLNYREARPLGDN
jgi:hypothetical protein